jgi:hypothetical protein
METKKKQTVTSEEKKETPKRKRKSKITLWWEKNPEGIGGKIINMRAVLK